MKIKYGIVIVLFITMLIPLDCFAYCPNLYFNEAKKIAVNVNFSYSFYKENEDVKFKLIIDNVFYPISIIDNSTNQKYFYNESNNGEIIINGLSSGEYKFTIYSNYLECKDYKLIDKVIELPYYNKFYSDSLCEGKEKLKVCNKWTDKPISEEEFTYMVNSYVIPKKINVKEEQRINKTIFQLLGDLYLKYYWLILGTIIIGLMILIINLRKKDNLV